MLFAFIPLFMLFSFGLFVLCVWQYIAFGSKGDPTWTSTNVYKEIDQHTFLQVLNFIEFVWGIQFIRDSFNFIISGNAVEWYFNYNNNQPTSCGRPFNRLLCKNWGSVAGGSFVNAFFNLFGIIIDFFRVRLPLSSATPKAPADGPTDAAKTPAAVAPVSSTWPEPTPTPTSTSAEYPTATQPDSAKPSANKPTFSTQMTPASDCTGLRPRFSW